MRRFLISTALLGTFVAATSCEMSTAPRPIEVTVTATPPRAQLLAGEAVVVEVVITNVSPDTVRVRGWPHAALEVRDAAGEIVAFGRFQTVPMIAPAPRALAPGEAVIDRAPWAGEVNASQAQGEQAAAGVYQIRAAVPLLGRGEDAYAYSTPVTVELTTP